MTQHNHTQSHIPHPPEPPEDYECCQNGCEELCVFEIYKQQKADYDAKYGTQSLSQSQDVLDDDV